MEGTAERLESTKSHYRRRIYFCKRQQRKYPDYYVGYVGYHATFGSKYFAGYARSFKADGVTPRDQSNEAYRNTMKQVPNVIGIDFMNADYKDFAAKNAVIYCDPPYAGTTKYATDEFDYDEFWDWCRKMSKNNIVFVSEYNAPDDFECIWTKELTATLDKASRSKAVEKLFRYKM